MKSTVERSTHVIPSGGAMGSTNDSSAVVSARVKGAAHVRYKSYSRESEFGTRSRFS